MKNWNKFTGLLAVAALAMGCETIETKACTLIGCESGLTVALQAATWPSGSWRVEAKVGDETRSCTVTIPLPSDGQAVCAGALRLGTSGSALVAAQQSLSSVHLPDTPTAVTLTVLRDGSVLASKTFSPSYTSSEPNGPGCGPTCTQANAALNW